MSPTASQHTTHLVRHLHTKAAPSGPPFVPIMSNTNAQRCKSKLQVGRSQSDLRLGCESGIQHVPRSPILSPPHSSELSPPHEASTVRPTTIMPDTNFKARGQEVPTDPWCEAFEVNSNTTCVYQFASHATCDMADTTMWPVNHRPAHELWTPVDSRTPRVAQSMCLKSIAFVTRIYPALWWRDRGCSCRI